MWKEVQLIDGRNIYIQTDKIVEKTYDEETEVYTCIMSNRDTIYTKVDPLA